MADPAPRLLTVDEFFAWQEKQEELYEFVEGRLVPRSMTGATRRHDLLVTNAIFAFKGKLQGGPCQPTTADVALRTRSRRIRRPDMTVDCGPFEGSSLVAHSPVLILEVLSPSTERVDTIVKVDEY
jgi:Uma2 family endonuclease